jgi:hypothetical protein
MGPSEPEPGAAETNDQANRLSCPSGFADAVGDTTSEPCLTVHDGGIGGARDGQVSDWQRAMPEGVTDGEEVVLSEGIVSHMLLQKTRVLTLV